MNVVSDFLCDKSPGTQLLLPGALGLTLPLLAGSREEAEEEERLYPLAAAALVEVLLLLLLLDSR